MQKDFSSPEDELLKEVADFTLKNHTDSIMLSGTLQGKVLQMISCMIKTPPDTGNRHFYRL